MESAPDLIPCLCGHLIKSKSNLPSGRSEMLINFIVPCCSLNMIFNSNWLLADWFWCHGVCCQGNEEWHDLKSPLDEKVGLKKYIFLQVVWLINMHHAWAISVLDYFAGSIRTAAYEQIFFCPWQLDFCTWVLNFLLMWCDYQSQPLPHSGCFPMTSNPLSPNYRCSIHSTTISPEVKKECIIIS